MNFYKLTMKTRAQGYINVWFSSERDAVTHRRTLYNANVLEGVKKDHIIERHDIPVRKPELLEWLRSECV